MSLNYADTYFMCLFVDVSVHCVLTVSFLDSDLCLVSLMDLLVEGKIAPFVFFRLELLRV